MTGPLSVYDVVAEVRISQLSTSHLAKQFAKHSMDKTRSTLIKIESRSGRH